MLDGHPIRRCEVAVRSSAGSQVLAGESRSVRVQGPRHHPRGSAPRLLSGFGRVSPSCAPALGVLLNVNDEPKVKGEAPPCRVTSLKQNKTRGPGCLRSWSQGLGMEPHVGLCNHRGIRLRVSLPLFLPFPSVNKCIQSLSAQQGQELVRRSPAHRIGGGLTSACHE